MLLFNFLVSLNKILESNLLKQKQGLVITKVDEVKSTNHSLLEEDREMDRGSSL